MSIDICIPQNNEAELIKRASELGYSSIVLLYPFKSKGEIVNKKKDLEKFDFKIYVGTYVSAKTTKDIKKLQNLYLDSDLIAVSCQNEDLVRFACSSPFVDLIFEITTASGKDHFEYRRSNFNAIIANIMNDSKQAYALSFAYLLSFEKAARAKIFGREMQNLRLVRRKASVIAASFAREAWQMRLAENLSSFVRVIGLNYMQSKVAVSFNIETILKRKEHKRSKEFVRPGVRFVID